MHNNNEGRMASAAGTQREDRTQKGNNNDNNIIIKVILARPFVPIDGADQRVRRRPRVAFDRRRVVLSCYSTTKGTNLRGRPAGVRAWTPLAFI